MTEIDELDQIDWDNLFVDLPIPDDDVFLNLEECSPSLADDAATLPGIAAEATTTIELWIEELLMKDDDEDCNNINHDQAAQLAFVDDFTWSDLLVDSPGQPSDLRGSSDASPSPLSNCSNSEGNVVQITNSSYSKGEGIPNFESNGENDKSGDDVLGDDDPLSKKRKRQLRNRDAALRSRERKKMYVKDLEMKSRYMEAECRRLGRLLECCYAENQMLRISLGSAYGASLAKPESAVLSLESLLLVSLVWLMVNVCLLPLPKLPLFNRGAVPRASVKELGSAVPKGKRMKVTKLWVTLSFMKSKRCRASRIKMKCDWDIAMLCN